MDQTITLKSAANLSRLQALSADLKFDSLRLMIDPERTPSSEAVIEDLCMFLEEEQNGMRNSEILFSLKSEDL